MKDRFGREVSYLRVSVIDRCNLRCAYCMPHGSVSALAPRDLLTNDELVVLADIFAELGIRKVRLTGGEPLLRPGLVDVVRRLRAIPGIRELALSTNGLLLAEHARALKAAGLDRVNVSLDTLDPARFTAITGVDRWRSVMDGIDAAAGTGLTPLKLNAVLMRGVNDDEIVPLTEFAAARGFDMRFIEWMPTDPRVDARRDGRFFSSKEAYARLAERFTLVPEERDPSAPARSFHVDDTASRVGFISPLSNYFCASCNRLRLKANGRIKTCLHGPEELDFKTMLRGGMPRRVIAERIRETVFWRPEQHFLNDASVAHRDFVMTHVGG